MPENDKLDEQLSPKDMALSSLQCPSPPPILNTGVLTGNNVSQVSIGKIINRELSLSHEHEAHEAHQLSHVHPQQEQPQQPQQQPLKLTVDTTGNTTAHRRTSLEHPTPITPMHELRKTESHTSFTGVGALGSGVLRGRAAATAVVAAVAAATARDRQLRSLSPSVSTPLTNTSPPLSMSAVSLVSSNDRRSPEKQGGNGVHPHFYVEDTIRHGGVRSRSNSSTATSEIRNIPEVLDELNEHFELKSMKRETTQNLDPRLPQDDGKIHILFGACGSIASAKIKLIVKKLEEIYGKDRLSIQLILTSAAEHFVSRTDFGSNVFIWRDKDEWSTWKTRTDPVLHIELRRWADILIVAPLTANTLSKVALGICDSLLTNVIRAWNTQYPIVMAPSMVSYAYNSVQTKRHLKTIKEEMPWIEVLKPVEKIIGSYGDIGMGGMMDYNEIVDKIVNKLGGYPDDDEEDDEEENDNGSEGSKKKVNDKNGDGGDDDDDDDEDDDDDDDDDDEEENEDNDNDEENAIDTDTEPSQHVKSSTPSKLSKGIRKLTVAEEDDMQGSISS